MFRKLKQAFSKFSKSAEKESTKEKQTPAERKVGLFKRLETRRTESLLDSLEEELLQNNVAVEVSDKIISDLKKSDVGPKTIKNQLEKSIKEVLTAPKQIDLLKLSKKPLVIMFIGVNGVGKTTTIAKLAYWFKQNKKKVVLAASDTFRAAAIEQLQSHADKLKVPMIKHKYSGDPAAVAFDAIAHAKAKGIDIVMIDTAGRQHSSDDLMDELAKVTRVAKPDITILVVDSLTGNDAVEQAKLFNSKIGIDGSILTKTDADERGGAIISVGYETSKPILFLGTGQQYQDIKPFDSSEILKKIF